MTKEICKGVLTFLHLRRLEKFAKYKHSLIKSTMWMFVLWMITALCVLWH